MLNTSYRYNLRSNNPSFGESQVNICTFSDMHGREKELVPMYANIKANTDQIFINKDKESTLNIMAIVGDYFFNPNLKGYMSDKKKSAGDFQLTFLNSFIKQVKKAVPGLSAYFAIGNHDLDGGDKTLFKLLKKSDMQTIATNIDLDKSKETMELPLSEREKLIVDKKVLAVKDSKDPNKEHKILVLGLTSIGLDYFFPKMEGENGITDNLKVFDRFNHTEKKTKENELNKTYDILAQKISDFKQDNPDSPVIIMSHTGDAVAKFVSKKVPVDFILSGHDHIDLPDEDYMPIPGRKTKIISLAQDGKLMKSLQIHFNDDGHMDSVRVKTILSSDAPKLDHNEMEEEIDNNLKKDYDPLLKTDPENTSLSENHVRHSNNLLANTITDSILTEIQKRDSDIQAFGIASSAFRRGLADNSPNSDILNVMSGSIESQSEIRVGKLAGHNLAEVILENVAKNRVKPDNLPLIQWSGIKIDKAGIIDIVNSSVNTSSDKELQLDDEKLRFKILENKAEDICKCIEIKNKSGEYEPIDLNKSYKLALPNKFFVRSETVSIKKFGDKFKEPDFGTMTLNDLMREHLEENNYTLKVSDDVRIKE